MKKTIKWGKSTLKNSANNFKFIKWEDEEPYNIQELIEDYEREETEEKNKVEKIKQEDRPTCSCGRKMTIVEYDGYYETFKYFECGYCEVDPDKYKADDYTKGAYA